MVDLLPPVAIAVDHGAVAILCQPLFCGYPPGSQHDPSGQITILIDKIVQGGYMPFRDDQNMGRRLRIDITKGKNMLILIDHIGPDLATGHLAKKAVTHLLSPLILIIKHSNHQSIQNH
jgi:hypothetical protein